MASQESSWIENFAYVPHQSKLSIQTTKGDVYTYADVPFSVADAMADAKSVGKYHNQNLRGKYKCAKG
jgi:hypothetical protein